jgi:hypothetical protein
MHQQPQLPNWWTRNWKWFVPVVCVAGVVLIAGAVAFVYLIVSLAFGAMKSSGAYQQALVQTRADSAVVQALGSPIKAGFFVSGSVNVSGSSGDADLSIPISGPNGKATVYAKATKSMGEWQFSELVVEIKQTGERIDLLAGSTP